MSEKTYEFRTLCSKDIFPMAKLINKIGFKNFKECFQSPEIVKMISGEQGEEIIGLNIVLDVANIILEHLPSCEEEIYEMLSNVSNMTIKELEKMNVGTFFNMIVDFIKKPEFGDFIGVVSKLFSSKN